MSLRFAGYALDSTGYGELARLMLSTLHEAGYDIQLCLLSDRTEAASRFGEAGALVEYLSERVGAEDPTVNVVMSPPNAFERGKSPTLPNVGFTMCESAAIPPHWVAACNRMDGLLVPAELSKHLFEAAGVTVPIAVVPPGALPVPPALPRPVTRPWTFLSVFDWTHPHKDPRRLLQAYWRAFAPDADVLLRVKTFARGRDGERNIIADVNRWKAESGLTRTPKLELVMGSWSHDELMAHYLERTDCYVSSHHSEGWGLPIWEAMRVGLPVVATGYGGNAAFMDASCSLPVAYVLRVSEWADVDVEHLSDCMRWTHENPDLAADIGTQGRAKVLRQFTREASAKAFAAGLAKLGVA